MKNFIIIFALFLGSTGAVGALEPVPVPDPQLASIIKEIQAQQAALAENQAKIDEKLVSVAEAVRVARIYASRSGR